MKRKLVYLEWIDAVGPADFSWMNAEQVNEYLGREMLITEVGWVIDEDKEYISLVAGMSEESEDSEWCSLYHRLIRVPQRCIKKRKDLTRFI